VLAGSFARGGGTSGAAAVVEALNSLLAHVGGRGDGDGGGGEAAAARAVVESVLELPAGLADGSPGWYRRAACILGFLMSVRPPSAAVASAANTTAVALASLWEQVGNRRLKLRCARVLRVLHVRGSGVGVDAVAMVTVLRGVLADVGRMHAAYNDPSSPSRLTVEAADCVLAWCARPPTTAVAAASNEWNSFSCDALIAVGSLASVWHTVRARLYSAAATTVADVARSWSTDDAAGADELVREAAGLLSSQPPTDAEVGRVVRRAGDALRAMSVQGGPEDSVEVVTPRGLVALRHAAMVGLAVGRSAPAAALAQMASSQCGVGELLVFAADPAVAQLDCSRRFATELLRTVVGAALRDNAGGSSGGGGDEHLDALFSLARTGSVMAAACSGVLIDLAEDQPDRVMDRVFVRAARNHQLTLHAC
jgi:hypothetical protein